MSLKESKWDYMGGHTGREGKGKWYNFIVILKNKRNNYFKAKQKAKACDHVSCNELLNQKRIVRELPNQKRMVC